MDKRFLRSTIVNQADGKESQSIKRLNSNTKQQKIHKRKSHNPYVHGCKKENHRSILSEINIFVCLSTWTYMEMLFRKSAFQLTNRQHCGITFFDTSAKPGHFEPHSGVLCWLPKVLELLIGRETFESIDGKLGLNETGAVEMLNCWRMSVQRTVGRSS